MGYILGTAEEPVDSYIGGARVHGRDLGSEDRGFVGCGRERGRVLLRIPPSVKQKRFEDSRRE